jgi:hypothetical protein
MDAAFRPMKIQAIVLTLALAAGFWACKAGANELALGRKAKGSQFTSIPIEGLRAFNGITIEQLYKMRSEAANRCQNLLSDTYEPSDAIFGMCESRKPWWGIVGMELYGPGNKASEGPSKESAYILNPYRLVSAEVSNSKAFGGSEIQTIWNPKAMTPADQHNPPFPLIWESGPVQFNAARAAAQVTYEVSSFNQKALKYGKYLFNPRPIMHFSLIAYNARDFNYHFIYLDPQNSLNVRPWPPGRTVEITQFLHCGGSCGCSGGCNNMSPFIAELDHNTLLKLPARASFKLWNEEPPSVGVPADFTFIIDFK